MFNKSNVIKEIKTFTFKILIKNLITRIIKTRITIISIKESFLFIKIKTEINIKNVYIIIAIKLNILVAIVFN